MTTITLLEELCTQAFKEAFPSYLPSDLSSGDAKKGQKIMVTEAPEAFGHFQCNIALQCAKELKQPPTAIAKTLLEKINNLKENTPYRGVISNIDIKGAGFINFYLSPDYLAQILLNNLHGERFGVPKTSPPLKIVIDYSSPNIAKEMHVGHLRTTIIGDSLNRLFRFLGHHVLPLNHVGDWGTQFGMLIAYLKYEVAPDKLDKNEEKEIASFIKEATLTDLVHWYKSAKKKFDEDPAFKRQAHKEVIALQRGEKESLKIWTIICNISRQAYQQVYQLLQIDPKLTERGESYYDKMLEGTVKKLESISVNGKKLVTVSDGAKCVFLEGFMNREGEPLPLMLQKSDGGYNYSTTDLTALYHRVHEEKADTIIYVVDAGQSLHFAMVFKTAQLAGIYDPTKVRVVHVPFGLVLKQDGKKFKTREGDTERLIDLIQTAIDKSKAILLERNKEIDNHTLEHMAVILGVNAIKYADLACNRESDYVFSYDKMLRFEGNTAAFIMYAYVRILSIQKNIQQKYQITPEDLLKNKTPLLLEEPTEIALALLLCQFEDMLHKVEIDLMPHRITEYLYRLAEKFHLFFHQCRVEGAPSQNSRLLLCEAVAKVLKLGMEILGLRPLTKM